jgi:hypothetical protein
MGTATSRWSRSWTVASGVVALALIAAGCGSSSSSHSPAGGTDPAQVAPAPIGPQVAGNGAFTWLRTVTPPSGWRTVRIPLGASMSYPPGWRRLAGDAGTATAGLLDADHHFLAYLNLTPRQSTESLANWGRFRVAHNVDEGDRNIKTLAVGTGLRFGGAHGSCVRDAYTTAVGTHYVELACLVAGRRASVVIVGASPPQSWPREAAVLERAISGVRA